MHVGSFVLTLLTKFPLTHQHFLIGIFTGAVEVSNSKADSQNKTVPTAPSSDHSLAPDSIPSPGIITVQSPLPVSDPLTNPIVNFAADVTTSKSTFSVGNVVEDVKDSAEKTPTTGKKIATEISFEGF